jgi:2-(1,2-epoxy-1,2-dihydrophenyl)acetyl-CoA isomerase
MVPQSMQALIERLRQASTQTDPRPIVLTGSSPAFCMGADLKWVGACSDPAEAVSDLVGMHHSAVLALLAAPVPVVAAINGAAAGGGLSLALAADYRIAAESATFTAAYFALGLPPDGGNSAFLTRTVGTARAMELLLTNRRLRADEALAWGLVNEVAPDAQLLDRARDFAARLPRVPATTLLATRRLLDASAGEGGIQNQLQREALAMRSAARQPTFRAALQAFLDRPHR